MSYWEITICILSSCFEMSPQTVEHRTSLWSVVLLLMFCPIPQSLPLGGCCCLRQVGALMRRTGLKDLIPKWLSSNGMAVLPMGNS